MTTDAAARLDDAEHRLRAARDRWREEAGAMAEPEPDRVAELAVDLAAHAALPVACDAGFLHLLRINFFFDHPALPHWLEARLLLSPLMREEGLGLYTMDPALRERLLARLAAHHGPERQKAVAMLLWQYTDRHASWADRRELRHAQQLTALNFLAPDRAAAWLARAEGGAGGRSLDKSWFVAMRGDIDALPAGATGGDVEAVSLALLELLPASVQDTVTGHLTAARLGAAGARSLAVLLGPDDDARWVALQLARDSDPALLIEIGRDGVAARWSDGSTSTPVPAERFLEGLDPTGMAEVRGVLVAVLDGAPAGALATLLKAELARVLMVVGSAGSIEAAAIETPLTRVPFRQGLSARGAELGAWAGRHKDLMLAARSASNSLLSMFQPALAALRIEPSLNARTFEGLCVECGVRWPDVQAAAMRRLLLPPPRPEGPLDHLAREYERLRDEMTPGQVRTAAMESLVGRMREAIAAARATDTLPRWTAGRTAGERLVAIVMLQQQPHAALCEWLAGRVATEKPFVGYHAMRALRAAAERLEEPELDRVVAALEQAAQAIQKLPRSDTDRGAMLEQARYLVQQRRTRDDTLPLIELNDSVLLPLTRLVVPRTEPGALAALERVVRPVSARVFVVTGLVMDDEPGPLVGTLARAERSRGRGTRLTLHGEERGTAAPMRDPLGRVRARSEWPVADAGAVAVLLQLRAVHAALVEQDPALGTRAPLAPAGVAEAQALYPLARALGASASEEFELLQAPLASAALKQVTIVAMRRLRELLQPRAAWPAAQRRRLPKAAAELLPDPVPLRDLLGTLDLGVDATTSEDMAGMLVQMGRIETLVTCLHVLARRHPRYARLASGWFGTGDRARERPMAELLWPAGKSLHIAFLDGSPEQQAYVLSTAAAWFRHANLELVPVSAAKEHRSAELRASFNATDGSWSYCGTEALVVKPPQATMNLAFQDARNPPAERRAEVLRLFGHALGLINEHQNPNARLRWNKTAVYKELTGPPNYWSRDDVDRNVFTASARAPYRAFDTRSVMLFYFAGHWFEDGKPIGGATDLSASDKRFIAELYPKPTVAQPARPKAASAARPPVMATPRRKR